jgi:uncharacterized protein (TIGR04255 family)
MGKLPKAPLEEVILELKWELDFDSQTNLFLDRDYAFALGKFQKQIENEYPLLKSKFPENIPSQFLNHQTVFQFWKGEKVWPVIQLGPGIITVNETEKNYHWQDSFLPTVKQALKLLEDSYGKSLKLVEYSLRYIDVVKLDDYEFHSWESFIGENFNFVFENKFNTRGAIKGLKFDQVFDIGDLGNLHLSFSDGINALNQKLVVWQTAVSCVRPMVSSDILSWLDKAHVTTSSVFKEICKENFYGSFNSK